MRGIAVDKEIEIVKIGVNIVEAKGAGFVPLNDGRPRATKYPRNSGAPEKLGGEIR